MPPYHGGSTRIYNLARGYSRVFDVTYFAQTTTVAALGHPACTEDSVAYREIVFSDPASSLAYAVGRALNVPQLGHSAILGTIAPARVRKQIASADVIVLEQPWLFGWVRRIRRPGQIVVYDAHNVEADMFDAETIRGPRPLARKLRAEIDRQERDAVRGCDLVLATSERDAAEFGRRYEGLSENICVVPNGVDCSRYAVPSEGEREAAKASLGLAGKHIVLFCGARHVPNVDAVESIVALAMRERDPDVHFLIVGSIGRCFPGRSTPNLTFTGFVDDVTSYYRAADVALNPVTSGGGTNLKQVEYLAAGIPSIVTPFGARGIGIIDGKHGLVRDRSNMSEAIRFLRAHRERAEGIRMAGRVLAERSFDWESIAADVATRFIDLMRVARI